MEDDVAQLGAWALQAPVMAALRHVGEARPAGAKGAETA